MLLQKAHLQTFIIPKRAVVSASCENLETLQNKQLHPAELLRKNDDGWGEEGFTRTSQVILMI